MKTENYYDIMIVGTGIVGLTLASKLADTTLKIALLDTGSATQELATTQALRVSAITPGSKKILAGLELWRTDLSIFSKMQVWSPQGGQLDFDCATLHAPALGYIVQNHLIQTALQQACQKAANITWLKHQLQQLELTPEGMRVSTEGAEYSAALVIGADGANSAVRRLSNIDSVEHDYQHQAIVATVTTALPHQQIARQCFLPTGPLAFLPLQAATSASIVWSTNPAEAQRLLTLSDAAFMTALASAFAYRLGEVLTTSQRLSFPLRQRHAKRYIAPSLALIGDAAHTLHPLAGQGLNLGLADAAQLAKVILAAQQAGRRINSVVTLRQYERARKAENGVMLTVVSGLKRLFEIEAKPIELLRNTGMNLVNNLTPLKQFLMRQATGV